MILHSAPTLLLLLLAFAVVTTIPMASTYNDILGGSLAGPAEWSEDNEAALLEPFTYIASIPGKGIRSHMIQAFSLWLDVPKEKMKVISRIVNMLHNASLLVDDIEDDSQLRRGYPVAHKMYGIPQTINTANYVYFLAYRELAALRSTPHRFGYDSESSDTDSMAQDVLVSGRKQRRLLTERDLEMIMTEELINLHRGQGLDLLWRDTLSCPSEEEYVAMVNDKTGGLFRIAVKLLMATATTNTDVDYIPLVNLVGVYFQIRDDYMNLQSDEYSVHKGFAEDLTEGKFSFPVVHGIHADKSNRKILNVLQQRSTDANLKIHIIQYLRDHTKSFEYCREVMATLEGQVREEIRRLGGNPKMEAILNALAVDPPATKGIS